METKSGLGHHIKILLIMALAFTFLSGKYLYALPDTIYTTSGLTVNKQLINSWNKLELNVLKSPEGDVSFRLLCFATSSNGAAATPPIMMRISNADNSIVIDNISVTTLDYGREYIHHFGQLQNLPNGNYTVTQFNGNNNPNPIYNWRFTFNLKVTGIPPETPSNFKVNGSGNTVNLTWDKVENSIGYNVYRGTESITTTDNHYTFENLEVGTHIFYVDAYSNGGTSPKTPGITYDVAPPSPEVFVDDITATSANLSWIFDDAAISYDIFINDSLLANTIDNNYQLTNLNENTNYNITVIAKSSSGNSGPGRISFKTLPLPNPPTGLRATNVTSNSIDLSWNTVDGYISYILDKDGNILASTGGNTYKVSGLEPDKAYTFRVAVETQAGQSVYSEPVEIRTFGIPPETPSGLSYDNLTTSGFKVYWLRQDNTDSYNVYLNNVLVENVKQTFIFNPSCTFSDLDPNKGYSVSIVAINKWGMSSNSAPLTVTTIAEPPSDLRAFDIKSDSVKLTWTSVKGAIKYILDQNGNIIATTTGNESNSKY